MVKKPICASGVVGWREWIALPDFTDVPIKAKIDTGARTSAIHAWKIRPFLKDGAEWVEFELHPNQKSNKCKVLCQAPVLNQKVIKSSNGHTETRYTIESSIGIGAYQISSEITLTNRDEMGFRMLIGRSFLNNQFIVDCGHSYIQGRPVIKEHSS